MPGYIHPLTVVGEVVGDAQAGQALWVEGWPHTEGDAGEHQIFQVVDLIAGDTTGQ